MSASLVSRRLNEVRAKIQSLDDELDYWKKLTEQENRGLRRHHSQVLRISTVLDGLTEPVRRTVKSVRPTAVILDDVESWENEILAAHSIWEVFRSKLVLREDELFRSVLSACDDLLWSCYGPAMNKFAPDSKGPPLVYFTATWSPFAKLRDSSFHNEVRGGAYLTDDRFVEVLSRLPVPLVSLPWYQTFHLPGALILIHECAHIVESDFGLTADLETALASAGLQHTAIWTGWASEVFADIYGCLMMGPAFAAAMMDLLTISTRSIQTEVRKSGKYPTRALRVELMLETLAQQQHRDDAQRMRMEWEDAYGPMQTMVDFLPDVPKVVSALLAGPYKGIPLTAIGPFPLNEGEAIKKIGQAAVGRFIQALARYEDPRLLFAGAQWIHENSAYEDCHTAYMRIAEQVIKRGANQFRMRGEPVAAKVDLDAGMAQFEVADRETGRQLRDLLRQQRYGSGQEPESTDSRF